MNTVISQLLKSGEVVLLLIFLVYHLVHRLQLVRLGLHFLLDVVVSLSRLFLELLAMMR